MHWQQMAKRRFDSFSSIPFKAKAAMLLATLCVRIEEIAPEVATFFTFFLFFNLNSLNRFKP